MSGYITCVPGCKVPVLYVEYQGGGWSLCMDKKRIEGALCVLHRAVKASRVLVEPALHVSQLST